jgi:hypothetical protein
VSDQIINLEPHDRMTPKEALTVAQREEWSDILIVGWQGQGDFRFLFSRMSHEQANWLIDRMKIRIHEEND